MIRCFPVAAAFVLAASAVQSGAQNAADLDPRSKIIANAAEVLNYKIEGVSLNTPPSYIETTLLGRGYRRVHPVEPPKLGHTTFIYVKGNAVAAGPADAMPTFSGGGGYGYEVLIMLAPYQSWMDWPTNGEKMYIAQIRYQRLPPVSETGTRGKVRMFPVSGRLPDSADRNVLTDFKAYLCAKISDPGQRALHCARNLDEQIHLGSSVQDGQLGLRDGSHSIGIKLRAVRSNSELALTHGPT
jgi:hypothetical protein